jgi:hypothetical protein
VTRILLDHNVPFPLTRHLPGHEVVHASTAGWSELSNGLLIAAAEADGFGLLITCDQNLEYQQNLTDRRLALIVLSTNKWAVIRVDLQLVIEAAGATAPSGYQFIAFKRPPLRRRPYPPSPDC